MARKSRIERIISRLPDRVAARVDGYRPGLAAGFGGPLNGQRLRIAAVTEIFARLPFDLIVETGTYRGTTTTFLRTLSTARIVTIEANPRFARYSHRRLRGQADTRVIAGDSAVWIRRLAFGRKAVTAQRPFFYLDAHGSGALPLRWELLEVTSGWRTFCVVIDDFEVPGDPGYACEDYGVGFRLSTDLLAGLDLAGVVAFWPAGSSSEETGRRRGWLVLGRGQEIVDGLRDVQRLREDPTLIPGLAARRQ